jgi:hypothetical protein
VRTEEWPFLDVFCRLNERFYSVPSDGGEKPKPKPSSRGALATMATEPKPKPPVAKKVEYVMEMFGDTRIDNYYWLRDDSRTNRSWLLFFFFLQRERVSSRRVESILHESEGYNGKICMYRNGCSG